jgi:hypothetical protein
MSAVTTALVYASFLTLETDVIELLSFLLPQSTLEHRDVPFLS